MPYFLKILNVAMLASIKFFYSPIYAFAIGLDFWGSFTGLVLGGFLSFIIFYYATDILLIYVRHLKPVVILVTPHRTRLRYQKWKIIRRNKSNNRKRFCKKNRFLVRFRNSWGMWGIIFSSPILLSIPFGAFLLQKYYSHRKIAIPAMLFAIIIEGLIINSAYWFLINVF
jgi:hypothetical protein